MLSILRFRRPALEVSRSPGRAKLNTFSFAGLRRVHWGASGFVDSPVSVTRRHVRYSMVFSAEIQEASLGVGLGFLFSIGSSQRLLAENKAQICRDHHVCNSPARFITSSLEGTDDVLSFKTMDTTNASIEDWPTKSSDQAGKSWPIAGC